jgi:hypothetical protein
MSLSAIVHAPRLKEQEAVPARRFDAVLVDIDHSRDFLLDPQNAAFYGEQGLSRLAAHLCPGGIFALSGPMIV